MLLEQGPGFRVGRCLGPGCVVGMRCFKATLGGLAVIVVHSRDDPGTSRADCGTDSGGVWHVLTATLTRVGEVYGMREDDCGTG